MSKRTLAIVDCHDRALHYVQKAIARKRLDLEGLTMVHFDAHPDFTIPLEVDQKILYNKKLLEEKVSIESWIFPLVAAGHVNSGRFLDCLNENYVSSKICIEIISI